MPPSAGPGLPEIYSDEIAAIVPALVEFLENVSDGSVDHQAWVAFCKYAKITSNSELEEIARDVLELSKKIKEGWASRVENLAATFPRIIEQIQRKLARKKDSETRWQKEDWIHQPVHFNVPIPSGADPLMAMRVQLDFSTGLLTHLGNTGRRVHSVLSATGYAVQAEPEGLNPEDSYCISLAPDYLLSPKREKVLRHRSRKMADQLENGLDRPKGARAFFLDYREDSYPQAMRVPGSENYLLQEVPLTEKNCGREFLQAMDERGCVPFRFSLNGNGSMWAETSTGSRFCLQDNRIVLTNDALPPLEADHCAVAMWWAGMGRPSLGVPTLTVPPLDELRGIWVESSSERRTVGGLGTGRRQR